jgi:hypothetical protein
MDFQCFTVALQATKQSKQDKNAHRGCKNSGIYNRFAFAIKTLCLLVPGGHTRVWHSNLSASLRESWPPPLKSGRGGGGQDSRSEALKLEYHTLVWPPGTLLYYSFNIRAFLKACRHPNSCYNIMTMYTNLQ